MASQGPECVDRAKSGWSLKNATQKRIIRTAHSALPVLCMKHTSRTECAMHIEDAVRGWARLMQSACGGSKESSDDTRYCLSVQARCLSPAADIRSAYTINRAVRHLDQPGQCEMRGIRRRQAEHMRGYVRVCVCVHRE